MRKNRRGGPKDRFYERAKEKERRLSSYRLAFSDWGFLKGDEGWGRFTNLFVNSKLHIVIAGRAAFEYDFFEDDDGKKQLEKTDVRMAAEKEAAYETSLSVLMERHTDMETKKASRTATILKDRGGVIDGQVFRDPTFNDFMPHVRLLNLGGKHMGVDATRNSSALIPASARDNSALQRRIVLDEIETLLVLHFPSTSGADEKAKLELLRRHFHAAWAEIEAVMPLDRLRAGYDALHVELEGKPSRYGARIAEPAAAAAPTRSGEMPDIPANLRRTKTDDAGDDPDAYLRLVDAA
jgi:hypothetical protein